MVTQRNHWNGSSREENKESPATQILLDSFLPPSVVPCAVLLLETPSGASYRKCLPKIHFKFSFEVPSSDLSRGSFPDFIKKEAQRNLRTCLMLSHPCVALLLETSAGVH